MKRTKGFTLVELLVVVAIIAMLVAILLPVLSMVEELANRSVCASNLKNIGAGIRMYQTNNKNHPPWFSKFPSYAPGNDPRKTGLNAKSKEMPDQVSPTAMMFMLVRAGQNVDLFLCPSDDNASKMDSVKFADSGESYYYWDFCDIENPEPGGRDCKRVSYSTQAPVNARSSTPYYPYSAGYTRSSKPGLAVMADKTPRFDFSSTKVKTDWTTDLSEEERKNGMSQNHDFGDFINVLFADYHVRGSKRADVGIDKDNIYSSTSPSSGVPTDQGEGNTTMVYHTSKQDSYLVGPIK